MDLHHCGDERLRLHAITKPFCRKAAQLDEAADAVTITFHDPRESGENGYTALSGSVRRVSDMQEREANWKGSWGLCAWHGLTPTLIAPRSPSARLPAVCAPPIYLLLASQLPREGHRGVVDVGVRAPAVRGDQSQEAGST